MPDVIRVKGTEDHRIFIKLYGKTYEIMEKISEIRNKEYYVKMMMAWYFATALTKNWGKTINIITEKKNTLV